MIYKTIPISVSEHTLAKLFLYIIDNSVELKPDRQRPIVIICPGGGYCMTSDREAEPVALQYLAMGYHAAILRYSVKPAKYPAALLELGNTVKYLKEHAQEYHIDSKNVFLQGFSAGGHLAGCLGVLWNTPWLSQALKTENNMLRPTGMILSYPVITSGRYTHKDSFFNLLGFEADYEQLSLEKLVTEHTIPTFLWHTADDELVPVENSLLFFSALRKAGICAEIHIFPHGRHGLSLANSETSDPSGNFIETECQSWLKLADNWIKLFLQEDNLC